MMLKASLMDEQAMQRAITRIAHEILERNRRILSGELVPENRNAHVGLFNSYRRLKYFYGEEASVTLDCEPGLLTVFTIRFPYHLDAEALEGEEAAYMERGGADAPDEME